MGTKPSTMEDKTEGLLNELEAFVDETDKLKEIRAEEERKRISLLIGVDVSDLTWIKDGQGTQSSQFDLMGDRWGGRAFVKGQKLWVQEELEKGKQLLHRIEQLQNQQGEVVSQEEQKGIIGKRPETTVFLKREREFFRCWWDAKSKGELVLPEDTALMLLKLIEPLMVDNAKVEEENTPTKKKR